MQLLIGKIHITPQLNKGRCRRTAVQSVCRLVWQTCPAGCSVQNLMYGLPQAFLVFLFQSDLQHEDEKINYVRTNVTAQKEQLSEQTAVYHNRFHLLSSILSFQYSLQSKVFSFYLINICLNQCRIMQQKASLL